MLIRVAYRVYRAALSVRHWIERRLTPAGILVLVGFILSAALGVDIERAVTYQMYALLFALMSVAMASAWFFRGRLEIERSLPRYGTVGQPLLYRVKVRNQSNRLFRALELMEDLANSTPTLAEFISTHGPRGARSFCLARTHRQRPGRRALIKPVRLPTVTAQWNRRGYGDDSALTARGAASPWRNDCTIGSLRPVSRLCSSALAGKRGDLAEASSTAIDRAAWIEKVSTRWHGPGLVRR